jgi:class 3 adenylate cyclase
MWATTAAGTSCSSIGMGINTGVVIAGPIGGRGKLEFTLIGDTVNVAAPR